MNRAVVSVGAGGTRDSCPCQIFFKFEFTLVRARTCHPLQYPSRRARAHTHISNNLLDFPFPTHSSAITLTLSGAGTSTLLYYCRIQAF